jgi:TRAP-type transport system periplasmic protein
MKRMVLVFLSILLIATLVVGCSQTSTPTTQLPAKTPAPTAAQPQTPAAAPASQVLVKFGTDLPPMVPPVAGMNWWAEQVTKQTEGRVKVEMYPASTLASQANGLDAVRTGVADMFMLSIGSNRKAFPVTAITCLPGTGFPDHTLEVNTDHMNTFFDMLNKYPAVAAEFKDFAPVFFYVVYSETYLLTKSKKVTLPADVKGLKVGSNGIRLDLMNKMGAAGVTDVPNAAYEKMQTGVTDASFVAISAVHDFKLYEVTKYVLDVPFGGGSLPPIMNKNTWNKISPQDQKLMKDLAIEGAKISHKATADANLSAWKEVEGMGKRVNATKEEKAAWDKEFQVTWDEYVQQNEAAGVKEARDVLNFWKAGADKAWNK